MASFSPMYNILADLSESDFKRFKSYLNDNSMEGFERIPKGKLEKADVTDVCVLMEQRYTDRKWELAKGILKKLGRADLVKRIEESSRQLAGTTPNSERDGAKSVQMTTIAGTGGDVTSTQLMEVAKLMGKEWKQVGIGYLGLSKQELENIQEENERDGNMQRFSMLDKWKMKNKGKAGLKELYHCLNKDDVPSEIREHLEGMLMGN